VREKKREKEGGYTACGLESRHEQVAKRDRSRTTWRKLAEERVDEKEGGGK